MKIKVGVIFGGESVEHEVSIISAVQAMNKMDGEKYEIIPIYITKEREWYTGEALKDIETFQDMDLVKRYCKNIVLYEKSEGERTAPHTILIWESNVEGLEKLNTKYGVSIRKLVNIAIRNVFEKE